MAIVVSSSKQEKVFSGKDVINVGTNPNCDFILELGFDVLLTLQYNNADNKCVIMNTFQSDKVLFKGEPVKGLKSEMYVN
ncbi:MAG: hypothetical protein ACLSA2_01580 [Candidatus Gastranaerophilaceae bacterium]